MSISKKLLSATASGVLLLSAFTPAAFAAPFNAANNNPQVQAYYPTGDHGIAGESDTHTGQDLVMKAGNSGNFQQWFQGTSTENGGNTEGDHSVWKNVGDSTTCNGNNSTLVTNANPSWGNYLQPGANYCVHTNDSH